MTNVWSSHDHFKRAGLIGNRRLVIDADGKAQQPPGSTSWCSEEHISVVLNFLRALYADRSSHDRISQIHDGKGILCLTIRATMVCLQASVPIGQTTLQSCLWHCTAYFNNVLNRFNMRVNPSSNKMCEMIFDCQSAAMAATSPPKTQWRWCFR